MKPFLLLATRAEDLPADDEYAAFQHFTGLAASDLVRVRMEAGPLGRIDLDDYSGIFVGGGPFNASDPAEKKTAVQLRVEAEFAALLDDVVTRDFPFFGACYGVGTLGTHQGAVIDGTFREPISVVEVALTPEGTDAPLLAGMPETFSAFVGHKEAITVLPSSATLLVRGEGCPVQMFRVGRNVYATQFHPECDVEGISTRIRVYAGHGYFGEGELEPTLEAVRRLPVVHTGDILRRFAERYAR